MPPPDLPAPPDPGAPAPAETERPPPAPVLTAAAVLAATSGSQLEATLHDIVTAAVEHVDARYGAMGVLTPDGRRLDRFVIVGMEDDDGERIRRLPTGKGILGLLVEQPIALRLDDLTTHPASTGFPAGHPPMRSFLGVPVRVRDAVFGNLYLTEKRTGGRFTPADVEVAQALAAVAGLAIENARLAERTERRRRWDQAATEMATALLSGADPDDVLRTLSTHVSALSGGDVAGVMAPSPDDESSLTIVAAVGDAADELEGVRVPLQGTTMGATWRAGTPRLLDDIANAPVEGPRAAVSNELAGKYGPAMVVPLGAAPALGLVATLRRVGREPFDREDLDLLGAFATQAAVVLELAHSQQRERRLQVQADRDRIARDLHDHVVQRIFATALSLDRLSRTLAPCCPGEAAQLARSVDELDGTMEEIRAAIFELHEQDGRPGTSLEQQLADIVRQVTEGHPLRRDVRLRGSADELPRDLLPDLVAVVRELVTNVVRHARAGRVSVTVTVGADVRVVVADDGVGLPTQAARSGLVNLADRAERRGGRLTANGGSTGTEVRWIVPLAAGG
ncbi:GAF domain-containing protein [Geodermatophilus sp. YIM 151500]|uniref:sensor histidine kinase n=1 Tax=Geodermatophilus sp. YIM 151500 TaxID=2984531 RepID=UPI0021E41A58|nr:GAF domain-containing protein [Geodermatophilus sp. YIM 151500]MCV2490210.1 GAF domain-containing protein [Geodermatophilus sp. YIM 151500]